MCEEQWGDDEWMWWHWWTMGWRWVNVVTLVKNGESGECLGWKKIVISLESSYSVTKLLDIPKKKENNFHRNSVSKTLITQGQNNGTKFLYK